MEVMAISGMIGFCLGYLTCIFLVAGGGTKMNDE